MSEQNWQEVKLGALAEYVTVGYVGPMAHEYLSSGIPFLRSQDIKPYRIDVSDITYISETFHEKIKKSALQPGDVVIVRTGRPGTSAVVPKSLSVANCSDMVIVRPGQNLDSRFLCYYINSIAQDHVSAYSVGAVQQHYNVGSAKELKILLPPLPEQRAIARILGALDDKIELNRRMNHTLEEMARALFKSWFVDFDPVTAKAEGRVPFGMNAETASLFPAEFEETEEGNPPKGWRYTKIGEVMTNYDSRRVPLSGAQRSRRQGIYPYYGAASVMDHIDDYLFEGIYLLVGEDGSVVDNEGMAVTQYVWGKFWVNNHAHVIQGINGISTEHLYLHYKFEPISPYVTGAVQPKINQGNLNSMPFLLPSKEVAEAFTNAIKPWFAKFRANQEEIRTLSSIRDSLLPKLMSGDMRVKGRKDKNGFFMA